jgi:hypothetical protein
MDAAVHPVHYRHPGGNGLSANAAESAGEAQLLR